MKSKRLLLMLLMALLVPWAAQAQETLTVYDETTGTLTSLSTIPMYGNYFDAYAKSEFVIPADQLSDMNGGTITSLKFYIQSVATYGSGWSSNQQVFLKEVSSTSLSAFSGTDDATIVWEGSFTVPSSSDTEFEITFTTPYEYQGGNLLVGIYNITKGGYRNVAWYGQTVTGASGNGTNSSSLSGVSFSQRNFIPKTTFTYEPAATGGTPKPTGFAVSNVLHNQADLSWNENGSATSWEICVNDDEVNLITATTNPYTLTGLSPLTSYTVKVRSVGSPNSDWTSNRSFTTTAFAEVVGDLWSDDFEGASCGWELINGTLANAWAWGTAVNNGGSHAIYVSNDGGATNAYTHSNTMIYATKLLNFADGKYEFSYNWNGSGESTYDYLRVALVPAAVTLTASTSYPTGFSATNLPTDWIALDGGSKLNLATAWQNKAATINVTAGNYYMVLAWRNDGSGGTNPPAAVDNVSISKIACDYDVEGLAVSNITTTTADIAWTDSEAGEWQVAVKEGADEWEIFPTIFTTNGGTLTGLTAATNYQVKVRAYCDADHQGSWCETITFATACDAVTTFPWSEDFESFEASSSGITFNAPCWVNEHISGNGAYFFEVYSGVGYSGSNSTKTLRLHDMSNGTLTKLMLPEMTLPGDNYLFSIDVFRNASGSSYTSEGVRVFVSADGEIEGATELAFLYRNFTQTDGNLIPAESASGWYTYELPIPMSGTCYIILRGESQYGSSTYMDNFIVKEAPSCIKPTGLAMVAGYPTAHSVSFTWDYEDGEVFQFALPIDNVTDPEQVTWNTTWYAGEAFPVYGGLTAETTRTFWLRKKCSDTDFSEPVYVTFTTPEACPAPTGFAVMPNSITGHTADLTWEGTSNSYQVSYRTKAYMDGIEEGFSANPAGWLFRTGALNADGTATLSGTTSWTRSTNNGVFDTHIYMNMYSTKNYWLITPSMEIQNGDALSFDMAYTAYSGTQAAPTLNSPTHRFAVLISTDDMTTWTILREWNNSGSEYVLDAIPTSGQNSGNIDLSAYAGQTAYIAFFGHSEVTDYDNNFHFDNVAIGTPVEAGEWQYMTEVTEVPCQLTGLLAETEYEAWLQGDCGSEGLSTEVGPITFTTDVACPAPTGFALEQLKSDHVVLNWNVGADAWQIQINDNTVYTDIALEDVTINEGVATYTLNGLTENTAYTLKLRANCGDEGYSQWTSPLSFTTLEACPQPTAVNVSNIEHYSATVSWEGDSESFTVMYRTAATMNLDGINEGFEDGTMPNSWTTEGPGTWTVGTGDYSVSTGAHSGSYNAKINHGTTGNETYLVTPNLDLSGQSGLNVNLWYINRSWAGDTDGFGVYYRINGGEWNEIFATTEATTEWTEINEALPAEAYAANCQFGFKFTDNYGYGVAIDDITIGEPSSNPAGDWMSVEANDSPANLNGLAINTKYEVKVIPACDATVESDIVNFTTASENEKYFITEGNWGEDANWEPAGAPTINQTVELRANTTITGEAFAKSISQGNYTITIEDGAKLKHLNSGVVATVKKNISGYENYTGENNGGYYLIANPMTSSVTPSAANGFLTGNFDLYNWNYDDINNEDNEWINFEAPNSSFTSLNSGAYGYLYANETGTTLTYTGTINAYTGTKGRSASPATNPDSYDFPSWYLYGNPYLYDAYLTNGITNGTAMAYYRMNEAGDRIVPATAGTPIAPMEGFFFQGTTDYTWIHVVTSEPAIASEAELLMTVSKGRSTEDNAIIVFGGNQSLGKMSFRANSTKLYMPVDNKDYAIVSTESSVGEMPVSFKAENNGTYTLSFSSKEVSFSYLHLIDNMTGADVNLLNTPSYTFDARTTDYANRFRLVFATGSSAESDNFGFVNAAGNLCIFGIEGEATLQVVDVLGHVVSSNQFSGSYESKLNVAPGVYMLRLINGNDVKVQKMVIK